MSEINSLSFVDENFPGTVIMVSHDRFFLRRLTTRVFELDRHQLKVYDGRWEEYLRARERG
jgi:ATP-binding cassette, subfamily F, member 3